MESNIWENWVDLPRGNFQQDQSEWEHHTLHSLSFLKPGVKNSSSSFWAQLPFRSFNPWPSLLSLTSSSPSSPERKKKRMDEVFFPPLIYWILPFPNLFPSMILLQHSHHSEQVALTERKALLRCALPIYHGMQSLHYLPRTNAERCQLPCQQCVLSQGNLFSTYPSPTPAAAGSPGPETCISYCKVDAMPTKSWQTRKDQETVSGQGKLRKHEKWTQWGVLA